MNNVTFDYKQSFCHVSVEKLEEEQRLNKNLGLFKRIQKGVLLTHRFFYEQITSGVASYESTLSNAITVCTNTSVLLFEIYIVLSAIEKFFPLKEIICIADTHPLYVIFGGPIIEEILFRGCLNNGIFLGQKLLKKISPNCLKGRFFNYITSPSPRLLTVHGLFSLCHLATAPAIFFTSSYLTLLHETTGSIVVPISAHIAHNTLSFALQQFVCR